jgi:hypothetical protein
MWVTALVHLTTGIPWAWWLGRGNASEHDHLRRMIPTLPGRALVVADAGYDVRHRRGSPVTSNPRRAAP